MPARRLRSWRMNQIFRRSFGLREVPCHPHFGQRCTPGARRLSAALMMKSTAFSEGMALISPLFQA
jgi:hypothetical protein